MYNLLGTQYLKRKARKPSPFSLPTRYDPETATQLSRFKEGVLQSREGVKNLETLRTLTKPRKNLGTLGTLKTLRTLNKTVKKLRDPRDLKDPRDPKPLIKTNDSFCYRDPRGVSITTLRVDLAG